MHPTCSTKCHREASWHIGMKHRSKFIMGTQKHQRPHGLILKIEITTKFEGILGIRIQEISVRDTFHVLAPPSHPRPEMTRNLHHNVTGENSEAVNGNGKADMAERRHLASVSTALLLAVGIGIFDGGFLLVRTLSVLTTTTLATSMAARQGPIATAAHQICLQVWLAVSLITDALAASGQACIA
ncbi:hypothetical protein L2E82_37432 [Cichorium intybus]|uniref:Uncharacterized protein n=1 Tax=Cichorium intybus TaxID=13427 RepID=A0ACB9AEI0_CICIN|nr:hypothetical protein L2E82_37432 [Cichorium intybus]